MSFNRGAFVQRAVSREESPLLFLDPGTRGGASGFALVVAAERLPERCRVPGGITLSRDPASAAFVADVPGRLHFDPVAVGVLADDGADIVRIWMAAACESPYGKGRPEQHRREQAELPSRHQATDERVKATARLRSNINANGRRRQDLAALGNVIVLTRD